MRLRTRRRHSSMSWIGAVDQGTTSTRFFVFDEVGRVVASARRPVRLIAPQPGWVEQDPEEVVDSVVECIEEACRYVQQTLGEDARTRIKAVGLANQRETTVAWDAGTGKSLHPAIVWMDGRNHAEVKAYSAHADAHRIKQQSGLPFSTYFSAGKMRWLLDHSQAVRDARLRGTLRLGTIDSWLLFVQCTAGLLMYCCRSCCGMDRTSVT